MNDKTEQGESDGIDPIDTFTTEELIQALARRSEAMVFAHISKARQNDVVKCCIHGHRTLVLGLGVEVRLSIMRNLLIRGEGGHAL